MIPWLEASTPFPDVATALTEQQGAGGLLAAGADLSAERLLDAYRHGIFPWYSIDQPILWWSPDPRMVLKTDDFIISASLKKTLRKFSCSQQAGQAWEHRFDSDFQAVMQACAAPRSDDTGTWISPAIIDSYTDLYRRGYAHSSEVWYEGQLVGGAYGVSIGQMFYGESMFARVTDASKIALAYLVHFLRQQGVRMIDCQQQTRHLASLGALPIRRTTFMDHLNEAIKAPQILRWDSASFF